MPLTTTPKEPIEYAAAPSRLRRWLNRLFTAGVIVTSHAVAIAATFALFVGPALLLSLIVVAFFAVMIFSAGPGDDGPPPLMLVVAPIGVLAIALCLAIAASLTGIVIDTVRRALKWPWWTGLPTVFALALLACLAYQLARGSTFDHALLRAAVTSLLATAVFCVYWIPMGCAEGIIVLAKRAVGRFATWRKTREKPALSSPRDGNAS